MALNIGILEIEIYQGSFLCARMGGWVKRT